MIYKKRSHNGKIIVASVLIASAIGLYVMSESTSVSAQSDNLTSTAAPSLSNTSNSRLISHVERIESIDLDERVFTHKVFINLEDQTIDLPAPAIGRSNPFAPVGGASGTAKPKR